MQYLTWIVAGMITVLSCDAMAQQPDPAKLGSVLRQQRDMANDAVAQCSIVVGDLQAKVADLEKQLAAAKQAPAETEAPK